MGDVNNDKSEATERQNDRWRFRTFQAAPSDSTSTILLNQFYLTLNVIQQGIEKTESFGEAEDIRESIATLFKHDPSWRIAYEIEQMQCLVLSGNQLNTELRRRLNEAQEHGLDHVDVLKAQLGPEEDWDDSSEESQRAVLHRLVNDLQWFYSKRFQRKQAARLMNHRVSKVFLTGLLLLLAASVIQVRSLPPSDQVATAGAETAPAAEAPADQEPADEEPDEDPGAASPPGDETPSPNPA